MSDVELNDKQKEALVSFASDAKILGKEMAMFTPGPEDDRRGLSGLVRRELMQKSEEQDYVFYGLTQKGLDWVQENA